LIRTGLSIIFAALLMTAMPGLAVRAGADSCTDCHLHRSFVEEAVRAEARVETLAGFHGREFMDEVEGPGCRKCHGDLQSAGELPGAEACLRCHTRGKTAQGEPQLVFHAEKKHWPMRKVSCVECHKGHVRGNPGMKFLSTETTRICARCHERTFSPDGG
jgi:predicted CXXCH cytochrome family protein